MTDSPSPVTSYDTLPYIARALPQTHPDSLAVAAALHGMTPVPVERCRVLEIGCANGANLLPMAEALPESQFVGIDLSSVQIAEGQSVIDALGLKNLTLRAADLMTLDDSIGAFDYIICHGVYSWVPPAVQDRILQLCARQLSPNGVAYISYNTYPGFHKRQPFREMIRYHAGEISDPTEAARQGRMLLEFLLKNVTDQSGSYARLLRDELEKLRALPLSYLFHEHLEDHNHPCYFHEFMARASAHGLQFVSEAEGKSGFEMLPEAAKEALSGIAHDVVRREQYIDFLRNSSLRSTILCAATLPLKRDMECAAVADFQVLSGSQPEGQLGDLLSSEPVKFRTRLGAATVEYPPFKALLMHLYEQRPRSMTITQLASEVSRRVNAPIEAAELCEMAAYAYCMGLVYLRARTPQLAATVAEKPVTSPLNRLHAQRGMSINNGWHQAIAVDAPERQILMRLDGEHDQEALARILVELVQNGTLKNAKDGADGFPKSADLPNVTKWAPSYVEQVLNQFCMNGLLTS